MIRFTCSHCGKGLKAPPDKSGALARCPACGQKSKIPAQAAAPDRPAPFADDEPPNVELVADDPSVQSAPSSRKRGGKPPPIPLKRVGKLLLGLVAVVLVLLGSIWGGMAFKAGGIEGAPKSWAEFKARLFQQAESEATPEGEKTPPQR